MTDKCVFCEIVAGRLPVRIICENEFALAIVPKHPESEGHTVVIPKEHAKTLYDITLHDLGQVMKLIQDLTRHLMEDEGYAGVNLLHASGESAQQSVQHFHIHLFPRKPDDGLNLWPQLPGRGEALKPVATLGLE